MRRFALVFFAALCLAASGLCAEEPVTGDVRSLQLAYDIADYGYEHESPTALILAAEMFSGIKTQPFSPDVAKEGASAAEDSGIGARSYEPFQLLDDAQALAEGDKTVTKYIAEVRRTVGKGNTRGLVSGPRRDRDCAAGNGGSFRYNLMVEGNARTEVMVRSLDGCSYDLSVYDQSGHLIGSDATAKSSATVVWTPAWEGVFSVVVKNTSAKAGRYEFIAN